MFGRLLRGKLTLDDMWLLLPPLMLFATVAIKPIHSADFWWHLRTGQIIVESGHVPTTDLFTFTRFGQPWTNQGWLMQVGYYLLYRLGDLPLIILVHALLITAGYVLVETACLQNRAIRPREAALGTLGAMSLGLMNWGLRPQGVSFLCFGLLVYMLERYRLRAGKIVWGLPILFTLWGNLHGGVVFGLGLLAIYMALALVTALSGPRRTLDPASARLLGASGLSMLALSLNPLGPIGAARYVFGFLRSSPTLILNVEFQSLTIRQPDGALFFVLIVFLFLLMWRRRIAPASCQVTALVVFGLASLYAQRIVPWFGMIFGPAFAGVLAASMPAPAKTIKPGLPGLNLMVVGCLLLLDVLALPWLRPLLPSQRLRSLVFDEVTPKAAATVLCGLGPDVRPFTQMFYGSYLAWACPSTPVFIDTRLELYPPNMWDDYLHITYGRYGWPDLLQRYGVNAIFAYKGTDDPLIAAAHASGDWETLYEDDYAVLMKEKPRQAEP